MVILIAIGALVATFLGGLFAIKWSDKLHLILGFSAGALLGVAFFDLLPESLSLGESAWGFETVMLAVALGFFIYLILDRVFFMQCHDEGHAHKGWFGAGSLSFHSFLDGIAIGMAFHVSAAVGAVVAAAVLVHDFSDGINTVSMILRHGGDKRLALRWLAIDAVAPVAGIAVSYLFSVPDSALALVLSVFCGFFLYIGASDLLPESHHSHPTHWNTFALALGMLVIYLAVRLAGI